MKGHVQRMYGLTLEEYTRLLKKACDLCGDTKKLNLDHDHTTGRVRGTLCTPCNTALGRFGDNEEGIEKVLAYLRSCPNG